MILMQLRRCLIFQNRSTYFYCTVAKPAVNPLEVNNEVSILQEIPLLSHELSSHLFKSNATNPKTLSTGTNPKTLSTGTNPETLSTGTNPKTLSTGTNPKTLSTGTNPETLSTGTNPGTLSTGTNKFVLPELEGSNLLEHFRNIATKQAKPYLKLMDKFQKSIPPEMPSKWVLQSGWTKYKLDGTTESVPCPTQDCFVFDIEVVMGQKLRAPTLAVALTDTYWYSWCSGCITSSKQIDRLTPDVMIPLDPPDDLDNPRICIAHNTGFDRSFVKEQYTLLQKKSPTRFWDTMCMHISYNGLTHDQLLLKKFNDSKKGRQGEDAPQGVKDAAGMRGPMKETSGILKLISKWVDKVSANNLAAVYALYCKGVLDKEDRKIFEKGDLSDVRNNFQTLMSYCAKDVYATTKVFQKLYPLFKKSTPEPMTYAGLLEMGCGILPVDTSWYKYMDTCDTLFAEKKVEVGDVLNERVETVMMAFDKESCALDPWLFRELDWTPVSLSQNKINKLCVLPTQFDANVMYPKWVLSMLGEDGHGDKLTAQMDVSTQILRLLWDEEPVIRIAGKGLCTLKKKFVTVENGRWTLSQKHLEDLDDFELKTMKRIPHPKGGDKNLGRILTKDMMSAYEIGKLKSADEHGQSSLVRLMTNLRIMSYWIAVNQRLKDQLFVWLDESRGMILPRMAVSGTVTRRATEDTWLTASNAKMDKLGSEYKSLVRAPPGYSMVGADVDSQEQWIAALIGDSYCAQQNSITPKHGLTPFSNMLLMGCKEMGTDQHSYIAKKFGITRDAAKVINYGRLYGAGLRNIENILKMNAPEKELSEVKQLAAKLLEDTKGKRNKTTKMWEGGSESDVFNSLETIAEKSPMTPVLKVRMSKALTSAKGQFAPSKLNWIVQSSGVDFLHLLLVSMKWLCQKYDIKAMFSISIHDEVRFLVTNEDKYRCALALQYSNLYTRAYFSYALGINDLPQSVQWFSSVDVDTVLRKEPSSECKTPSNPLGLSQAGIPLGEGLTMDDLLKIVNTLEK